MWQNTIGKQIRRGNLNLLFCNLILAFFAIAWLSLSFRSLSNQFLGPQAIDTAALQKIIRPQKSFRYYYQIKNAILSPPIFLDLYISSDKATQKEIKRDVISFYQLMPLNHALLVVKSSSELPTQVPILRGALVPLPAKIRAQIVEADSQTKLSQLVLPTMFDTERFQGTGPFWALLLILPLLGLAFWNIKKGLARRDDYAQHPLWASLRDYGRPQEVADMIESELADKGSVITRGPVIITKNWMLKRNAWGMQVQNLENLIWTYPFLEKTYFYFVSLPKSHTASLLFKDKSLIVIPSSQKDCAAILATTAGRAPWALAGYSEELAKKWRKAPEAVIAEVDNNKHSLKQQIGKKQPGSGI